METAAIPASPWAVMDPDAVVAGTDANWKRSGNGAAVYSDETYGTGMIANPTAETKTSADPLFSATTSKRGWGYIQSKHLITKTDTLSYIIDFDLKSVEGAYDMAHGGIYVYLRSQSLSNYLDDRFGIMLRRNFQGVPQISIKKGGSGASSVWLNVTTPDISLTDNKIRIIDSFETNTIKVYATNSTGVYKLIGTISLDSVANTATLVNTDGDMLSFTYGGMVRADSCLPAILFNEYPGMVSNLTITYPYVGPADVKASVESGTYLGFPEVTLSTVDENGSIFYTVDGTDPVENEDGRMFYSEGDIIDLNPEGLELPATFTLKAVVEGESGYGDVATFSYRVLPDSYEYALNPDNLIAGTDENWSKGSTFGATTFNENSTSNDSFWVTAVNQWGYIYPKFTVSNEIGDAFEYSFSVKNVMNKSSAETAHGFFISVASDAGSHMQSQTVPFIFFDGADVGFHNSDKVWGNTCVTTLPHGLNLTTGAEHFIRIIETFDGTATLYIDNQFVAKYVLDGSTFTMTNMYGDTISRDGVKWVKTGIKPTMSVVHNTAIIKDFKVSYSPETANVTYPTVTINSEDGERFLGDSDDEVTVSCDEPDALLFYTFDGTLPTDESDMVDGDTIIVPTLEEEGAQTLTVRAFLNDVWGPAQQVTYNYLVPSTTYTYNFNDETISADWAQAIDVGNTTMFALTESGKLTPQANYSMINYKSNLPAGKSNTVSFTIQDLDVDGTSIRPFAYALRGVNPNEWFNGNSENAHMWLMFKGNTLAFKAGQSPDNAANYRYVTVDADFTNETKVTIIDNIADDFAGIFVQDPAGTTEPKLIAYVMFGTEDVTVTDTETGLDTITTYPTATLYSMLGESTETLRFKPARYSKEYIRPVFMTYNSADMFTLDDISITIDNTGTKVINTLTPPVFTEEETGSEYYNLVKIEAKGVEAHNIFYTLDGTEPTPENGKLYKEGSYVIINKNATLKAASYATDGSYGTATTSEDYSVTQVEKISYPFDAEAAYGKGSYGNWKYSSNNTDGRPTYWVNEDGSFTLDGYNGQTVNGTFYAAGGVGGIMTIDDWDANNVVFTEFDAKSLGNSEGHTAIHYGMRQSSYQGTSFSNNTTFYAKIAGNKIGINSDVSWTKPGIFVDSGVDFDTASSEYQHYMFIDDKINNVISVFVDDMFIGKYIFTTTNKTNDTVTVVSATGESASRVYGNTINKEGQFYIAQAYLLTNPTYKNLVTYAGNYTPEYDVVFDAGEFGTLEGTASYKVVKNEKITTVPTVISTSNFVGWTTDNGKTVLTSEELLNYIVTDNVTFTAVYNITDISMFELTINSLGSSPAYIASFDVAGFRQDYSVYYTLDGSAPTADNGILWDGKLIELTETKTVNAIAVYGDTTTEVVTSELVVNQDEKFVYNLNNKAIVANNTDDYFGLSHNKADETYPDILTINEDGSLHFDGTNYQPKGSGVSTILTAKSMATTDASTVVYSFDVKNGGVPEHGWREALYLGIRATTGNLNFATAIVENYHPTIVLQGNKIGFKNGNWGTDASITYAENTIEEFEGITSSDWVNIKVIDDRTTNKVVVLADNELLATFTISGTTFTMIDLLGTEYSTDYANEIANNGRFSFGSAYYTTDMDNLTVSTGIVTPEVTVEFSDLGHGTLEGTSVYTLTKYSTLPAVPVVNAKDYATFKGWQILGNSTIYTSEELLAMPVPGNVTYVAAYDLVTTPAFITIDTLDAELGRNAIAVVTLDGDIDMQGTVDIVYDPEVLTFIPDASHENVVDNEDGTVTITFTGTGRGTRLAFNFINPEIGATAPLSVMSYDITPVTGEAAFEFEVIDADFIISVLKGDVNQNGKIEVYDAVEILKHIVGTAELTENGIEAAKVTNGDQVTIEDATKILKYIARIVAEL